MNQYETIFVTRPNLTDEESDGVATQMEQIVKDQGAKVQLDRWGKRRLAYEVKGCREGSYFLLSIEGQPGVIQELEQRLKLADQVIRHLTVRTDTEKGRRAPEPAPKKSAAPPEREAPKPAPAERAAPETEKAKKEGPGEGE